MFKNYNYIGKNIVFYNTTYLKYEKLNKYILKLSNNKYNKLNIKINKGKSIK